MTDPISALYEHATPAELAILDRLATKAGLTWRCVAQVICGTVNPAGAHECSSCGQAPATGPHLGGKGKRVQHNNCTHEPTHQARAACTAAFWKGKRR